MSTLTKEWLLKTIAELEEERDAMPGAVNEDAAMALAAMKLALASLEAEAVAFADPQAFRNFQAGVARREWMWRNPGEDLIPLYAAPPAPVSVPDDIDTRMKNAGMLSAPEIIAGQPIDAFMKHAGVVDLESLLKWSEMRRAEFLRMQAKYELGDNQKDDMYEWVISHVAAFSELHVNIRAAMLQGAERVSNRDELPDGWVACSERMPGRDYVLAGDFSGKQYPANMPNIQIGIYADWFDDGCPCWDDGDGNDLHLKQVTHWTQIPAAPQQEVK